MKYSFTSITKHIARKRVGVSDPRIMHPEREWFIGLAAAVCIFLIGAAFSANLYLRNRDVSVSLNSNANDEVLYRESLVKDALRRFNEREERLQEYLRSASPVVPEVVSVPEITDVLETSEEIVESEIVEDEVPGELIPPSIISE